MRNSEQVTRVSGSSDASSATAVAAERRLIDLAPGLEMRISRIEAESAGAVAAEGIVPGAVIAVERRIALGGPIVVRLGRARLALARGVARQIVVEPIE